MIIIAQSLIYTLLYPNAKSLICLVWNYHFFNYYSPFCLVRFVQMITISGKGLFARIAYFCETPSLVPELSFLPAPYRG